MLRFKTLVMTVLFSLFASAGLYSNIMVFSMGMALGGASYPVIGALALAVEGVSFVSCVGLFALYIYTRYKHDYEKGMIVDLVLSIALIVPFYAMWDALRPVVESWTWLHDFIEALIS